MRTTRHGRALVIAAYATVAGCLVGPAYRPPPPPAPKAAGYKEREPGSSRAPAMRFHADAGGRCSASRSSTRCKRSSTSATRRSRSACAELRGGARPIRAARAQYYPTVTVAPEVVSGAGRREWHWAPRAAATSADSMPTSYRRRLVGTRSLRSRAFRGAPAPYGAQATAADLESTRLLAQTQLAETYFLLRGQDALQDLLDATVVANQEIVDVIRARFDGGSRTNRRWSRRSSSSRARGCKQRTQASCARATSTRSRRCSACRRPISRSRGGRCSQSRRRSRWHAVAAARAPARHRGGGTQDGGRERRGRHRLRRRISRDLADGHAGLASRRSRPVSSGRSRIWAIGTELAQTIYDGGQRRATIDPGDRRVQREGRGLSADRARLRSSRSRICSHRCAILELAIEQQRNAVDLAERALELETERYGSGPRSVTPNSDDAADRHARRARCSSSCRSNRSPRRCSSSRHSAAAGTARNCRRPDGTRNVDRRLALRRPYTFIVRRQS